MAKILIVDDSNMLREMVRYALNEGGFDDVTEACDGNEGYDRAIESKYDLVITDVNMPNLNGLEFTQKLRGVDAYKKTPILILTTESGDDMKTKGKSVGATGWIVKPFVPERLLAAVSTVLK